MIKDEIYEMADQIDKFASSWNQCSTKRLPYQAIKELRNFLIEYFQDENENCDFKLKNGKIIYAFVNEAGNIEISKDSIGLVVDSWNEGYEKGKNDTIGKMATMIEHELIMVLPKDKVKYIIYRVHSALEQLREQKNEN